MAARDNGDWQRLRARYAACVAMDLPDEATTLAEALAIPAREQVAHLRARDHALDEWQPDRFDDFPAIPPGRFDTRVFEQATWWVDILRRPHRRSSRLPR